MLLWVYGGYNGKFGLFLVITTRHFHAILLINRSINQSFIELRLATIRGRVILWFLGLSIFKYYICKYTMRVRAACLFTCRPVTSSAIYRLCHWTTLMAPVRSVHHLASRTSYYLLNFCLLSYNISTFRLLISGVTMERRRKLVGIQSTHCTASPILTLLK